MISLSEKEKYFFENLYLKNFFIWEITFSEGSCQSVNKYLIRLNCEDNFPRVKSETNAVTMQPRQIFNFTIFIKDLFLHHWLKKMRINILQQFILRLSDWRVWQKLPQSNPCRVSTNFTIRLSGNKKHIGVGKKYKNTENK